MEARTYARATAPHLGSLASTLAPLLAVANAGSFHLRHANSAVIVEQGSFAGVDHAAVQNAVTAAPEHSDKLDAKAEADRMGLFERAAFLTLLDYVNEVRANPTALLATKTSAQFRSDIKAKVDSL